MRSTEIVTAFCDDVWNAHKLDAVDRFVADDVVIDAGAQKIAGKDNGKPTALTGTAVWSVADGKLQRGWVEQASFELYHWLLAK